MVRESSSKLQAQKKVFVVSNNKSHVENDSIAIRKCSLEFVQGIGQGAQAFNFLTKYSCDIIVCDSSIEDMDARTFLKTIKNSPSLKHIPVVMVTTENDRAAVLDAVSGGCSGYILRPYSQETFEKHMSTALQLVRFSEIEMRQIQDAKLMLEMGEYDDAIEEFEEVVSMQSEAQKYYDLGCKYLVREKYGKAIVAFQKAVKMNDLFAEAYQGLSEAFKGKGNIDQCQIYLKKAADIYAEYDHMEKVKEVFIDILKFDRGAVNPFNTLGVKLRKNGDYIGAIRAYKHALEITPNDENIYFNMSKAYMFMEEEENALKSVTMALRMNKDFLEALKLYKELNGSPWPTSPGAPNKKSAPDILSRGSESDKDV